MPGFILHQNTIVQCAHMARAMPTMPTFRVKVSGNMVVLSNDVHQVVACPNPVPPGSNGPCITAQYSTSALRVKSSGIPVLLFDSQAICIPTGVPLTTMSTQMRVRAQ